MINEDIKKNIASLILRLKLEDDIHFCYVTSGSYKGRNVKHYKKYKFIISELEITLTDNSVMMLNLPKGKVFYNTRNRIDKNYYGHERRRRMNDYIKKIKETQFRYDDKIKCFKSVVRKFTKIA